MEIIALQEHEEKALERADAVIRSGGLVAVPTDTVYGIIADAANAEAVKWLYELKHRPKEKAFPVFVKDVAMARWFAYISDAKARFLEGVWPGPVTMVFHHKEKLPPILTRDLDTIAMRVPNYPFLLALLDRLNMPLAQSSANLSELPPATSAQAVIASFEEQEQRPDLIIDGGECCAVPSTIINFTNNNPRIVRSGLMSKEEIDVLLSQLQMIAK